MEHVPHCRSFHLGSSKCRGAGAFFCNSRVSQRVFVSMISDNSPHSAWRQRHTTPEIFLIFFFVLLSSGVYTHTHTLQTSLKMQLCAQIRYLKGFCSKLNDMLSEGTHAVQSYAITQFCSRHVLIFTWFLFSGGLARTFSVWWQLALKGGHQLHAHLHGS